MIGRTSGLLINGNLNFVGRPSFVSLYTVVCMGV